jgi:hypothetical protein
VTAFRLKSLARAQMYAERVVQTKVLPNPGKVEVETIYTPFGTYTKINKCNQPPDLPDSD